MGSIATRAFWAPSARYTNPFSYAHEGATVLGYHAQDKAGNLEIEKTREIRVDTRAPSVTAYVDQTTYSRTQPFVVHFSSDDPPLGRASRASRRSSTLRP